MPRVTMMVRTVGMTVAMIMAMVVGHATHSTCKKAGQPFTALIRYFDTAFAGMN